MDILAILATLGIAVLAVFIFGGKKQDIIETVEQAKPKKPARGPDGKFVKKKK